MGTSQPATKSQKLTVYIFLFICLQYLLLIVYISSSNDKRKTKHQLHCNGNMGSKKNNHSINEIQWSFIYSLQSKENMRKKITIL